MLKGSFVALVTPFKKDGEINEESMRFLIDWQIKNKTDGILVCGTTGESATLSHAEHKQVVKLAVEHAKGRIPILAGAGSNSTKEALDLALFAQSVKADAILMITPYYNKPTQEGLYQHYTTVAKEVSLPLIIYNVPGRTGSNILPETVARIYKDAKSIIGIKEASGNMDQITRLMSLVDRDFLLLSGSDELNLPILSVGGRGAVSVLANIAPVQTRNLVDNFLKGNIDEARKLQLDLYDLIKMLFIETNPIPVKTSLGLMGLIEPNLRLPLCGLSDESLKRLKSTLKKHKLI